MLRTLKECPACGTMLLMKSNQKCCSQKCRQKAMRLREAAGAAAAAAATAAAQAAAEAAVAAGDWGYFQYKKREFSIQDIIIYHHIS